METVKTEFRVEVVRLGKIEKHPSADTLSITHLDGYPVILKTGSFQEGDLAVYCSVDSVVPTDRPEFAFLKKDNRPAHRIKAMRLRGVFSMGLLVKATPGLKEGEDMSTVLGVTKYIPKEELDQEAHENRIAKARMGKKAGWVQLPVYGLDTARKYLDVFEEDEDEVVITEKVHGCLTHNTRILMANGEKKSITKIKIGDSVLGVDLFGRVVETKVLNKFNNGRANDGWLRVKTTREGVGKGNRFSAFNCTPNHQIFDGEKQRYVAASKMSVGDKVLSVRYDLGVTPIQRSILLGKMLGDGYFSDLEGSAAIVWGHKQEDEEYLDWTVRGVGELAHPSKDYRMSGFGTSMVRVKTHWLAPIKELFGSMIVNGRKTVPEWVADALDPLAIAFWYMDDGHLGHHESQEDRAGFAVCSFTAEECAILQRGLLKFGIQSVYYQSDKDVHGIGQSRLRLNCDMAEKLFLLVAPYVPPCMQRKLPERYRGHSGWLPNPGCVYKKALVEQTILSIEPDESVASMRHDLETETHNFFANGVLVHNSNFRACFSKGRLWVGSHKVMRGATEHWLWLKIKKLFGFKPKDGKSDMWWEMAEKYQLAERLAKFPDYVLYGEIYGQGVQDLTYDSPKGRKLRFFDVYDRKTKKFLGWWDFTGLIELDLFRDLDDILVPVLYEGPWSKEVWEKYRALADTGMTTLLVNGKSPHLMEGIVIKTMKEQYDDRVGRIALKYVGTEYLLRKES